jgi:electron transfer flavoprotein alpha subunit
MTRPRRDPRGALARQIVPAQRRRIDRTATGGSTIIASPTVPTIREQAITIIAEPAFLVACVAEAPGGRLTPHDRQVLGAAQILTEGGGAVLLIAPPLAESPGALGADRVVTVELGADALAAIISALSPRHMIFPETALGGDLARRVAALTGLPLFPDIEQLTARQVARPARGRRIEQRSAPPALLSLAADIVPPYSGPPREARPIEPPKKQQPASGFQTARILPRDAAEIALAEADFVVAAGNGVTDFDQFHAMAQALGATPGASRVVCDTGKMPRDRQVGASGTVLSGSCYLALGISGAPQHLQGVAGMEHVIAVNTDLHAAMVKRAGLAIVADAQAVMQALIRKLTA